MSTSKHKDHLRLQELIDAARKMNIEVRTEKFLREIGYRVRSGQCRVNGRELILIDRDAAISEQIHFLSAALAQHTKRPRSALAAPPKSDGITR
jgi:hypothetical protein